MYIPNDINTIYEVLTNIKDYLGDDEMFTAMTNYFNSDQLKGFVESLITDYDLSANEVGLEDDYEDDEEY